jgi:hypothetical protein
MKAYGENRIKFQEFVTSTLNGSELLASRFGRFTLSTHWIGGRVCPIRFKCVLCGFAYLTGLDAYIPQT